MNFDFGIFNHFAGNISARQAAIASPTKLLEIFEIGLKTPTNIEIDSEKNDMKYAALVFFTKLVNTGITLVGQPKVLEKMCDTLISQEALISSNENVRVAGLNFLVGMMSMDGFDGKSKLKFWTNLFDRGLLTQLDMVSSVFQQMEATAKAIANFYQKFDSN